MATLDDTQLRTLMANPWFAGLAAPVRAAAVARSQLRRYAQGERLFNRGDPGHSLFGLLEGSVRISGTSRDGREAVLTFYEPGSWFGEISLLDGKPRTHDGDAHKPSLLLVMAAADFEALLIEQPTLARELLRLECTRLRAVSVALEAFVTQSLEQRFASRLLALAHAYGSDTARGLSIELHLSQEILAQLNGVTRQRVNQLLKAWEGDGLVEQRYGRIVLIDRARLELLAAD